jgi:hypothetical protein
VNAPFFIFADNKGQRNIVIEGSSVVYRETNRDMFHEISGITRTVYDFLLEKTGGTTNDLKLVGKIFNINILLPERYRTDGAAFFIAEKIGIPGGSDIAESGFRFMLKDGEFGIRCVFDSSDKDSKTISAVVDINNHEQESGLDKDFFDRVITFADTYYEKHFVDLLNELFI